MSVTRRLRERRRPVHGSAASAGASRVYPGKQGESMARGDAQFAHQQKLFQSTLPWFIVKRGDRLIRLTCPRRTCPGDANGNKHFYVEVLPLPDDKLTTCCVYCSAAARIPEVP